MILNLPLSALLLSLVHRTAIAKTCTRGKLFVIDANSSTVNIWNLDSLDPFAVAPVKITPTNDNNPADIVYASYTSNYVTLINMGQEANNYTDGDVHFIDAGVDGDVVHSMGVVQGSPRLVNFNIECARPIHYTHNDDKIAIFCDGFAPAGINSTVWIVDETKLLNDDASQSALLFNETLVASHHGVTVPIDDKRVLYSVPVPERVAGNVSHQYSLPAGFEVRDFDGVLVHGINEANDNPPSCAGFHGSGHQDNTFAFACNQDHGGILILNYGTTGTYTTRAISYPSAYSTYRTGAFTDHKKSKFFIGSFGSGDKRFLVSIDPNQVEDVISEDQLIRLSAAQCSFDFEQSGGQLVLAWMPTGNLQVYMVDPWVLVSDIQVVSASETSSVGCQNTRLVAGHGYAYILHTSTLYEVDIRDLSNALIKKTALDFLSYRGVVAGVPSTYACDGPAVPHAPSEAQKRNGGVERYAILHFEGHQPVPGSAEQASYIMQLRKDLSTNLKVGIDRIFVTHFAPGFDTKEGHHEHDEEDTDILIKLFFTNAATTDANQAAGAALVATLTTLLADDTSDIHKGKVTGFIEGALTEEPPGEESGFVNKATSSVLGGTNDDDGNQGWPVVAIAGFCFGLGVAAMAIYAAVVFRRRENEEFFDLEKAKQAPEVC
ncbi:hypothetical protein ACA910_012438 [Epithemia clementina (nom. ined.)]